MGAVDAPGAPLFFRHRRVPQKTHHQSENPNVLTTQYGVVPHERDLRSFAPRPGAAVAARLGLGPHRHPRQAPKPARPQERSARQGDATWLKFGVAESEDQGDSLKERMVRAACPYLLPGGA